MAHPEGLPSVLRPRTSQAFRDRGGSIDAPPKAHSISWFVCSLTKVVTTSS